MQNSFARKSSYGTIWRCFYETTQSRGTVEQINTFDSVIRTISQNIEMNGLWQVYRKKYNYAANITWEMAVEALLNLSQRLEI